MESRFPPARGRAFAGMTEREAHDPNYPVIPDKRRPRGVRYVSEAIRRAIRDPVFSGVGCGASALDSGFHRNDGCA